jgi:hypothetical protein
MSLIYKINKPTDILTVAELIIHLADFDLDSQVVCINTNNQLELLVCKEDPNNQFHREGMYDLEIETMPTLRIRPNNSIQLVRPK